MDESDCPRLKEMKKAEEVEDHILPGYRPYSGSI